MSFERNKKNNFFKKISVAIFILVFLASMSSFHTVHASVGAPFGGLDDFDDYEMCDCSGAVYSWFTPLYFLGPVPTTGALAWFPGTIAYPSYVPHPGAYLLGTYIPGLESCWTVVFEACVPVPTLGTIAPVTGVSPE